MPDWVLIPCLKTLRDEFNQISPNRDKGADGSIGNSLHTSSSDHTPDEDSAVLRDHDADSKNEVHALDIDSSGPWPGTGTQKERFHRIVMRIIEGEKAKWKSSTDKCRLNYVIWDSHIYDKDNDFEPVLYSGRAKDPHTNHGHFSGRYETSCENDIRPWGVYVPPTPPKETEMDWKDKPWNSSTPISVADAIQQASRADEALKEVQDLREVVDGQTAKLDAILAKLTPPTPA